MQQPMYGAPIVMAQPIMAQPIIAQPSPPVVVPQPVRAVVYKVGQGMHTTCASICIAHVHSLSLYARVVASLCSQFHLVFSHSNAIFREYNVMK
jgi:hypothetical protein